MKSTSSHREKDDGVAIIGIGCRFPGNVNAVQTFWKMLVEATDCTSEAPEDPSRFDLMNDYYHPTPRTEGKICARRGGYVDSKIFRNFDRQFFRMPPAEANHLDPQIRMLLEGTWEALEDAGIPPSRVRGTTTGVYIGLMNNDYTVKPDTLINAYTNSGTDASMASNRLSYEFDFRGPSYTIDTACSSSLYAVHQACEGIRRGDCDMAVAGGANVVLLPVTSIGLSQAQMISPDGRCKTFDASANGYSRGEGAGVVVLKSLRKALECKDSIYAVIRGGAMSNDGKTYGVSQPSSDAQIDLLAKACRNAGVRPETISYVEAHGTGTKAGDAAEANALGVAIGKRRAASNAPPLVVGSVKSNIGHTEGAAGVAGVIKAALILAKRKIPPSIHFRVPNPNIPFKDLHVQVCTDLTDLPTNAYVGCSSFGFGGANAHVILQESPVARHLAGEKGGDGITTDQVEAQTTKQSHRLLLLSASTHAGLKDQARNWINFLEEEPSYLFSSILYSAACRFQHHRHRLALVVRNRQEAVQLLTDYIEDKKSSENLLTGNDAEEMKTVPVVFAFSGMGTQWWAMGRQLLDEYPKFCAVIKEIDEHLRSAGATWSLFDVLTSSEENSMIHRTEISQPCIFAIEVAIVEVLREFGVSPTAVVGHSVGEVATAYTAGLLTLKQASTIIYHRGRLLEKTSGRGGMLAVLGDVDEALNLLPRNLIAASSRRWIKNFDETMAETNSKCAVLDVAAINSSRQLVFSGDEEALKAAATALSDNDEIRTILLKVNNAFHSYQQSSLQAEVIDCLEKVERTNGVNGAVTTIPMVSSVTAEYVDSDIVGKASYWWANIRQTVRFRDAVKVLLEKGYTNFVEIGAHSVLIPAIKDILSAENLTSQSSVISTLKRPRDITAPSSDETASLLRCIAKLHVMGATINFSSMYPHESHQFVPLPHYPWQREECWFSANEAAVDLVHPLLGERQASIAEIVGDDSETDTIIWKCEYSSFTLPWLKDHAIVDVIAPAAAYVETGLAAARSIFGDAANFCLTNVAVKKFMFTPNSSADVRVLAEKLGQKEYRLSIHSSTATASSGWQTHATMTILQPNDEQAKENSFENLASLKKRFPIVVRTSKEDIYNSGDEGDSYKFGPSFRVCQWAALSHEMNEILVRATVTEEIRHELHRYIIHPAFLDGCFQAYLLSSRTKFDQPTDVDGSKPTVLVPTSLSSCEVYGEIPSDVFIHLKEYDNSDGRNCADVSLMSADDGHVALKINQVTFSSISSSGDDNKPHFWTLKWKSERSEKAVDDNEDDSAPANAVCIMWFSESQKTALEHLLHEFKERNIQADVRFMTDEKNEGESFSSYTDIVMLLMDISESNVFETTKKDDFLDAAFASPLAYIKTLQNHGSSWEKEAHLRHWLVTQNGQAVVDGEIANPGQTTVAGCILSLAHELPDSKNFWVDLESADTSTSSVWRAFVDYFLNFDPGENEVALRRGTDNDSFAPVFPRLTEMNPDAIASRVSDAHWTVAYSSKTKRPILTAIDHLDTRHPVIVKVNCFGPLPRTSSGEFPGAWVIGEVTSCPDADFELGDTVLGLSDMISSTVSVPLSLAVKVPEEMTLSNAEIVNAVQELLVPYITFTVASPLAVGDTVLALANPSDSLQKKELTALSKLLYWLKVRFFVVHNSAKLSENDIDTCTPQDLASILVDKKLASAVVFLNEVEITEADKVLQHLKSFGSCIFYSRAQLRRFVKSAKTDRSLANFFPMMTTQDLFDEQHRGLVGRSLVQLLERLRRETNGKRKVEAKHLRDLLAPSAADSLHTFLADSEPINLTLPIENSFTARPNDSYLITGGLKGLGLSLAKWLVDRGAKHLHLLGRSLPGAEEAVEIEDLRKTSRIDIWQVDITSENAIEGVFQEISQITSSNLAGIFHCAAVYHDSLLFTVEKDQLVKVMLPKAYGAWLLHRQSLALKTHLRYFVLFSSIASLFGNSGQVSYCIANTVLNSLAEHRKRMGLPATSFQFGAISGAGFLQQNPKIMTLLKSRGLTPLSDQSALDCMGRAMLIQLPSLCIQGNITPEKYVRPAKLGSMFRFSRLKELEKLAGDRIDAIESSKMLFASLSPPEKRKVVVDLLSTWLGAGLGLDEVPLNASLVSIGFDSIMATEMSDRIHLAFIVIVPPVRMLNDQCSVNFLADIIMNLIQNQATAEEEKEKEEEETQGEKSDQNLWRYSLNSPAKDKTICHLICFPPYAAGASVYSQWGKLFKDSGISVTVLHFPGWEERQTETFLGDLDGLVSAALDAVLPLAEEHKVAFYGHSMGGLIAYEVALRLEKDHGISIAHFFVGAWYAPHLQYPRPSDFNIPASVFKKDAPLAVVFQHLKQLNFIDLPSEVDPLLQHWMSCFEIALKILKRYTPNENLLPCGIDAFSSTGDPFVQPKDVIAWEKQSRSDFVHHSVEAAGHQFTNLFANVICKTMQGRLKTLL